MKKHIIISAIACFLLGLAAYAIPAYPGIIDFRQPDGSTIQVRLNGDEYAHWYTTPEGTVLEFDANGFLKPASDGASVVGKARARAMSNPRRRSASPPSRTVTSGTVHIPVILVEFSDVPFGVSEPVTAFSNMLNQPGYSVNGGTGSVADFYHDNSNDTYNPIFDVYGPVPLSNNQAYYGGTDSGGDDDKAAEALYEAALWLDANTDIDFSQFDADSDGYVDMVLMYYAGYNQAEGGGAYTIWPHQWDMYSAQLDGQAVDATHDFDGKRLYKYFCTSEYKSWTGGVMAGIGTTCHEFAHSLGLPDVYDIDYSTNGRAGATYYYDTMCSGSYNNGGKTPPFFSSFELEMLGWPVTIEDLPASGSLTLPAFSKGLKKAYRSASSTDGEFFLYECRSGSWDNYITQDGLIVYHLDRSANDVYGYTAAQLWSYWALNVFGDHPCCYIIPAEAQNYTSGWGLTSGLYYGGSNFAFGVGSYDTYTPVDWAGVTMAYTLSSISFSASAVTFSVGGVVTPSRMSYINDPNAGVYSAGDEFVLELVPSTVDAPTATTWYYDGAPAGGSSVTLTAGSHVIEARLTLTSGATQVVELELDVD